MVLKGLLKGKPKKRPKPKKKKVRKAKPKKKVRKVRPKKKARKARKKRKARPKRKVRPKKKVRKVKRKVRKPKKRKVRPKKKVKRKVRKPKKKPKKKVVRKVVKKPKLPPIEKMPDKKAYELVRTARIPVVKTVFCKNEKQLTEGLKKIGLPAVLKVSGTTIIHKTEVGGVIKVKSAEEAADAFAKLMKIRNAEGVLIQKHASGIELIVGAKSDPHFGHVLSIGLGGIYVEVLKDVVFRVCPINAKAAEEMVGELKGYDILAGVRG
ncbi:MAG: acetate--CoA ligase family protein, partial [Candidatus Aenigmatarchaeota archaeon]